MRSARHCATTTAAMMLFVAACGGGGGDPAPPLAPPSPPGATVLDIATLSPGSVFARVSGAASTGAFGVPVAGGYDIDNDGRLDYAMSAMLASPLGRSNAGQVHLVFGDGTVGRTVDTAASHPAVLTIIGSGANEVTGSEIWMAEVTGDGIGDLLVGRQNYREPGSGRIGAGALSIVVGNAMLRDLATAAAVLDLSAPPAGIDVYTIVGAAELDRLGMWFRAGDVTGDGIDDVLIGADQEDGGGETNRGAAWLVRGGLHLAATAAVDLADFGATALAGNLLKITPPAGSANHHFGATVAVADLDNNLRDELLISASLSRAGGSLLADGAPDGSAVRHGGNPGGTLYIAWDDNVPAGAWPAGHTIALDAPPGTLTRIDGGSGNAQFASLRFAEDVLAGADYDGDGRADLFAGDIRGTALGRAESGIGHVFFSVADLRGLSFSLDAVPAGVAKTSILGIAPGAISADTSLHGDIDGDGIVDLAISSPLASPLGRDQAGAIHVLWGQRSWPATIDLATSNRPASFAITDVYGARGRSSPDDAGDTLMYSAAAADLDGDGRSELIVNEMRGNGEAAGAIDVGNLIIISGAIVRRP